MQSLCRIFLSKRKPLLFHAGFLPMVERIYPVVALNSALGFIKPLPIEERLLNQCHLLDQSIGAF